MFSGFNVELNDPIRYEYWHDKGINFLSENEESIYDSLERYICENNSLSASLMSDDWFPEIEADIFMSHSHADEDLVIAFAGWLNDVFGLRVFIDSMVWGYSNDLLKIIDNKYCLKSSGSYSYEKRNFSTSHVHMMLSIALTKMIDKCESVFFINTPNAIRVSRGIINAGYTYSPWIYSEIEITRMIRRKKLSEYRNIDNIVHDGKYALNESAKLKIRYDISLEHLTELNDEQLLLWQKRGRKNIYKIPMDKLYEITGILGGQSNGK